MFMSSASFMQDCAFVARVAAIGAGFSAGCGALIATTANTSAAAGAVFGVIHGAVQGVIGGISQRVFAGEEGTICSRHYLTLMGALSSFCSAGTGWLGSNALQYHLNRGQAFVLQGGILTGLTVGTWVVYVYKKCCLPSREEPAVNVNSPLVSVVIDRTL